MPYIVRDLYSGRYLKRWNGKRYIQLESGMTDVIYTSDINEAEVFTSIGGIKNSLGYNVTNKKYKRGNREPKFHKKVSSDWEIVQV